MPGTCLGADTPRVAAAKRPGAPTLGGMSADTSRLPLQASTAGRKRGRGAPSLRAGIQRIPHALRSGQWADLGLAAAILLSLLVVRIQLLPWQSGDYTTFLSHWFDYLRVHGFAGLGDEFANYNMPYLYLLFAASGVTENGLVAVKAIGGLSDLALALGCFALLRQCRVQREPALVAAAAVLLLPEVLLNSAAWGQADSTYGALLVWALWAALRDRARTTWVLFALAFAFKLQAAFVLPAFVIVHVIRRWGWQGPVLALITFLLTEVPALIAGRSPASLIAVYADQAGTYPQLTLNAPSLYALLPDSQQAVLRPAGMAFAVGAIALLSFVALRAARRRGLDASSILLFVTTLALAAPFTLPMMHERYFYVGNVLLFVYALVTRRLLPWALVSQAVAVMAYAPFLFETDPVLPMAQLALVEGAVLFVVIRELVRCTDAVPAAAPEGAPTPAPVAQA